jgi:DNA-binding MarR family transcriptional regulator
MDDMTSKPSSAGAASPTEASTAPADQARFDALQALEASFAEIMTTFRRSMAAAAERAYPGMLPGTYKVLSAISRCEATTLSSLAEQLMADKGLVSRSVTELEEIGLVARTADPADGRSRLIAVTPEGAERLAVARAPHEGRLFEVLEEWSLDDIRHLTGLLHALALGATPAR